MKQLFTLLFLSLALAVFGQPANDDCNGIIDLGVVPFCPDDQFFTNENATESDIGNDNIPGPNSCSGNDINFVGNDVWFQFTTSDTITDYTITVTGIEDMMGSDPMSNPQIMIYRGDCEFDGLALLACGAADDGESLFELDVLDLDPNETYFIRINDYSTTGQPNWGSFQLCIDEIDPINTIDQGGSNACNGELYDSGGPDEDYGPGENNSFSICPPFGQNACITLNFEYFNIENFSDQLIIFDGPDTNSPVLTSIQGGNGANTGGVCLSVQATSGCMTVQFISDGFTEFEGFAAEWFCSATPCDPIDQVTVDDDITDQDIIDNVSTPQTLVTIDTIICANGAYGTFAAGDNSELGLEQGLLLTSGSVFNALGPNIQTGITQINNASGDSDLDYLSAGGSLSNDACVVELDVFVATDELVFEYVFGSDEYPEFTNSSFNDIFAFLISGPGITGDPNIANQENIAVLPDGLTPVEINSVNDIVNWEYYRNNGSGTSLEYDGLTSDFLGVKKSLTARSAVIPCNTYHLKLAIADRGDFSFDSGVFISEIKGGTPNLSVNFASGIDYLIEDCSGAGDELVISINNPLPDSQKYDVTLGGTAILGTDYDLNIPAEVTIPAGQTQITFPIIPLSDGLTEGTETIIITLSNNFGCGDIELNQLVVEITDAPVVDIFAGQDTAYVCADECLIMEVEGAVDYFWEPVALVDNAFATNPETCPTTSQYLTVTGSVSALPGCSDTDSIWLQVVDPQLDIVASGPTDLCEGENVVLQAVNNVGNTNLIWNPANGLDATDQEFVTAEPEAGTYLYNASVTVTGCTAMDTITVTVDPFDFPTLTTTDTLICQGQSVLLANNIPFTTTIYEWSPAEGLSATDVSGPVATPEVTTTYTLTATSPNGACEEVASVNIEVFPAAIDIMPEDTAFVCLGELANLSATTTTGVIEWFPSEGLSSTTDLNVTADLTESMWYYATMTVGACTVLDSVYVRVDSLPEMPIQIVPDDQPYCPGEIITLVSPTYEPLDYPDIMHIWNPPLGAESEPENYNFVFTTVETATYVRTTTNNACSQTDQVTIEVIDAGDIEVAWIDTTICIGDPLSNTVFNGMDPSWSPASGLSCTECSTVNISAESDANYTVEVSIDGCPVSQQVSVTVLPDASADVIGNTQICLGQSVVLNNPTSNLPGTTYFWTADPADPTLDPTAPDPTVTPSQTTTYSLIVENGECDAFETEFTVAVLIDPVITVDPDITICANDDPITLNATSSEAGTIIEWAGDDIQSVDGNSITVAPGQTTTYTATWNNPCGDPIVNTVVVTVLEEFSVEINIEPDTMPYGEGQIVEITATPSTEIPGIIYTWGDGQTGMVITDTLFQVPMQTISVTATTPEGCTVTNSVTVDVREIDPRFPNVFTPTESENNFFNYVWYAPIDVVEFKIFNRWGEIVYDNDNPTVGWDGTKDGTDLPSDVYFYIFTFQTTTGLEKSREGDVTLLR
jgi:gliding motility-associated-like protein